MPGPNISLRLSVAGQTLIQTFEALRLQAYQDIRGVWTIGWGHTGPEVVQGLTWTQAQATTAFQEDILWAAKAVQDLVTVILNQNQFDGLVSFVFNIGVEAFEHSTLLVLLNDGNFEGAALQFGRWIHAGSIISSGLINRRKSEANLFQLAVT